MKKILPYILGSLMFLLANLLYSQIQVGNSINGTEFEGASGTSVTIADNGQYIAIGNRKPKYVQIFRIEGGNWTQVGSNITGAGYIVAMTADGNRVIISTANTGKGKAKVFDYKNMDWTEVGSGIEGNTNTDSLGFSVAITPDGNKVAIGAVGINNSAGSVEVYQLLGSNWFKVGSAILGDAAGDRFGHAVALSDDGNTLAVGANNHDENGEASGIVKIFQWGGGSWSQKGQGIKGDFPGDFMGSSVSLSASGDTLIAGANYFTASMDYQNGLVRVLAFDGSQWTNIGQDLIGSVPARHAGEAVSISGNGTRIAFGGPLDAFHKGEVRAYDLFRGNWVLFLNPIRADKNFSHTGESIDLSPNGRWLVIGEPYRSGPFSKCGQVRVFDLGPNVSNDRKEDLLKNKVSLRKQNDQLQIKGTSINTLIKEVSIYELTGRLINSHTFTGNQEVTIPTHYNGLALIFIETNIGLIIRKIQL